MCAKGVVTFGVALVKICQEQENMIDHLNTGLHKLMIPVGFVALLPFQVSNRFSKSYHFITKVQISQSEKENIS